VLRYVCCGMCVAVCVLRYVCCGMCVAVCVLRYGLTHTLAVCIVVFVK